MGLVFDEGVFFDVYLFQKGYSVKEDVGPLSMQNYSILNVSSRPTEEIEDIIDKMVGSLSSLSISDSCKAIRVYGVRKRSDKVRAKYIAVCGESHKDCHDTVKPMVKAHVDEIAREYRVVALTDLYLDLSVRELPPNLVFRG